MAANILAPLSSLNTYLLAGPVHSTFVPYPLLPCIHAARVSIAYRGACAGTRKRAIAEAKAKGLPEDSVPKMTLLQEWGGFLVMAWGGSFLSHYVVNLVPPQLLSFGFLLNYLGVHLFITLLFDFLLPSAYHPSPAFLDTLLPILDGATRAHAVFLGTMLPSTLAHPVAKQSVALSLLTATLSASGGGQLAGTLGVFNPAGWQLSLPPLLRARSLVDATDVWAPLLSALAFSLFCSSHETYGALRTSFFQQEKGAALLSLQGGKALITLIITTAYAWRAIVLHWTPAQAPTVAKKVKASAKASVQQIAEKAPETPAKNTRSKSK